MNEQEASGIRGELRQLLRRARFQGLSLDEIEDEIEDLFGGGVNVQPAPTPDQLAEPPAA